MLLDWIILVLDKKSFQDIGLGCLIVVGSMCQQDRLLCLGSCTYNLPHMLLLDYYPHYIQTLVGTADTWTSLLGWSGLLGMQLWQCLLYSRTQLDKLLLCYFQMGSNFLQVHNKDLGTIVYSRNNHKPHIGSDCTVYIEYFDYMQVLCNQSNNMPAQQNSHMIQQPPDNKEEENC